MIEPPKGDPRIASERARALRRNREGTNPNQRKGMIRWDFTLERVRIDAEVLR